MYQLDWYEDYTTTQAVIDRVREKNTVPVSQRPSKRWSEAEK
jgi:hypothetical protein